MLAVIVCNLAVIAMLLGLLAGLTVGFLAARPAIGAALAFDPLRPLPAVAAARPA